MKRIRFLALLITLCLLTVPATAAGCAICGGDAVCDTCGGLGYLEMKALTGDMVQVACIGGCTDGKCPDCTPACDTCGSDGLCDTCGGLGYLEMKAYGSDELLQIACTGESCAAGRCAVCSAEAEAAVAEEAATDVPQGSYAFLDPEVEKMVRYVLMKFTGDITYEDLRSVTYLALNKEPATFLDLAHMPNLTRLDLSFTGMDDLSPLAELTQLTVLKLRTNPISDLSPLAGLTDLTELELGYCEISDLSPLAGLTRLTNLVLTMNAISDLSPLAGLTNLTELELGVNDISDLSPLSGLTQLTVLWLHDNAISDLSPLSGLQNLTRLYLYENSISDVSPLSGLTQLTELWLNGNHISDVSSLAGLTNLSTVNLSDNQIADFSLLLHIADLRTEDNHPATATPGPTATPAPYKAPIAGNDGLLVMSAEEYLGIDACDHIYQQDNWYKYRYSNRGYKWYDNGTDDPVDWYRMKDYVDGLVSSGYYEVLEHKGPDGDEEYWCLGYTGPGSVRRTFGANLISTQKAAIVVESNLGDITVGYSLDVITSDLEDTQYRLGKNIFEPKPSGGGSSEEWCIPCGGSGDCSDCGGTGEVRKHVAGTTDYIYQDCLSCFGSGDCRSCGGDGWR